MASQPAPDETRLLTVEEFLRIDFGPDLKAELDRGVVRMMAGGTRKHASIQINLLRFLGLALRGSGCRPYGSDMLVRSAHRSLRYPDVTVDCRTPEDADTDLVLRAPRVVIEILSPSTRSMDEKVKLDEYRSIATVDTIALVDPDTAWLRVPQRTGPQGWSDVIFSSPSPLDLPTLGISVPRKPVRYSSKLSERAAKRRPLTDPLRFGNIRGI